MNGLGRFITEYVESHEISMNILGDRMGMSGSTVSRHASDDPPEPTVDFLDKLAQATGQDVNNLVNLYLGRSGEIPTELLVMARQFAAISDAGKDAVKRLILSFQSEKQR